MMNPQFGMPGMGIGMGFGMPNMPMQMQMQGGNGFMGMMNNQEQDQEWLKGFQLGVQEVNNTQEQNDDGRPKMNIIFRTTQGTTTNMVYPLGITMDQALQKYLAKVGRDDLYREKSNLICFLFNGAQLKFGDQTKIEVYFKNITGPKVVVNDVHNLIGA